MDIHVQREPSKPGATIGRMTIDGVWLCWTLEDQVREIQGQSVPAWKIAGKTAIPRGRYQVIITPSLRFGRPMPLLVNVPGFDGVRIHSGNTAADTEGCILLGFTTEGNLVLNSKAAFAAFFPQLEKALKNMEQVFLTVV